MSFRGTNSESEPIILAREAPFRVGLLDVSPATRVLGSGTLSRIVEPRVMQVLVALAQAKDRVVTRDELIARCWNGRVVGDNAVQRAISQLRKIGEDIGGGTFRIDTVARVGYLLVETEAPACAPVTWMQPSAGDRRPTRRTVMMAGGLAVLGLTGVAAVNWDRRRMALESLMAQADAALRTGLPEAGTQGVGFLEEAVRLAPNSARAWGRLALARSLMSEYAEPDQVGELVRQTQDAAGRAIAITRHQGDAHAALAILPPYFQGWTNAEARLYAALDIAPGHLAVRDALSFMKVAVGRAREGSRERLAIAAQDPLHAAYQHRLVYAHWILGDATAADGAADRGLQLWPKHPGLWFARLWSLALGGQPDRALAHIDDAARRPSLPDRHLTNLRQATEAIGSREPRAVAQAAETQLSTMAESPSTALNAFLVLTGLGETDRALDVAEAYLLERGPLIARVRWQPGTLSVNDQRRRKTNMLFLPSSTDVRSTQRFMRLVEDIGLAAYWDRAGVTPDHLA